MHAIVRPGDGVVVMSPAYQSLTEIALSLGCRVSHWWPSERLQQQGIDSLIFAGVTTEVCVQTSMREANDRGYRCLLIDEATESYFPEFKQVTLAMITAQGGIVGRVAHLQQLQASLGVSND